MSSVGTLRVGTLRVNFRVMVHPFDYFFPNYSCVHHNSLSNHLKYLVETVIYIFETVVVMGNNGGWFY